MIPSTQSIPMPKPQIGASNFNLSMFSAPAMSSESFTDLLNQPSTPSMHPSMSVGGPMSMTMMAPAPAMSMHTQDYSHTMAMAMNYFGSQHTMPSSMTLPGLMAPSSPNMNAISKGNGILQRSMVAPSAGLVEHTRTTMDASLLQASLEHPEAPNLLQHYHLEWQNSNEKRVEINNKPINLVEQQLFPLIDKRLCLTSLAHIETLMSVMQNAKTETEQAFVLVILRATAQVSSNSSMEKKRLAKACSREFEKKGGLKLARIWLENGVECHYRDLLILLLDVLKNLHLRLSSITEARINEPIVKLKKGARDEFVKRSAQNLLKYWRTRFTEREKAKAAAESSTATPKTASPGSFAAPKAHVVTPVAPVKAATTTAPIAKPVAPVRDVPKPIKKRPVKIKRLEHLPFGGGASVSKSSSDLIENLKQRQVAKGMEMSLAVSRSAKEPEKIVKESPSGSESVSKKIEEKNVSNDSETNSKKEEDIAMELPAIQSFGALSNRVSKKIRWADEQGQELVKVQLIESWRDLVPVQAKMSENSFQNAKLREHADERNALQSQKQRMTIKSGHEWYTPPLIQLPNSISSRQKPVNTEECKIQTARTRHEMEYLVLDGEIPQPSPKEWKRGVDEVHRSTPPFRIPLIEVSQEQPCIPEQNLAVDPMRSLPPHALEDEEDDRDYGEVLEEEAALRDALGPLQRSTISILIENEDVLPQVCEEAQRNGNLISDERILEIIAAKHARNGQGYRQVPMHHSSPHDFRNGYQQANMYPVHQDRPMHHMQWGFPHQNPNPAMKRKGGPSVGPSGEGILSDAPPTKRIVRKGPAALPCMYYHTGAGCKHGNSCQYSHDVASGMNPQNSLSMNELHYSKIAAPLYQPHHIEPFVSDNNRIGVRGGFNQYRPARR